MPAMAFHGEAFAFDADFDLTQTADHVGSRCPSFRRLVTEHVVPNGLTENLRHAFGEISADVEPAGLGRATATGRELPTRSDSGASGSSGGVLQR